MPSTTSYIWYWHGYRDRAAGMPNLHHTVPDPHKATYLRGWHDAAPGMGAPRRHEIP